MPWSQPTMSDQRLALVHLVRTLHVGVTEAAGRFGVSRKTAYKWLARHDADPHAALADRSRVPHASPDRTTERVRELALDLRDRFGWGARKIRADLMAAGHAMPSARTVHAVLERAGRIEAPGSPGPDPIRFERGAPNELWQIDFKAFIEADRRRVEQVTVLDDHSRFLVALHTGGDTSMRTAWEVLWRAFGQVGLPQAVLSDNAFSSKREQPRTISWFESRLIRLGIRPIHGRPYHRRPRERSSACTARSSASATRAPDATASSTSPRIASDGGRCTTTAGPTRPSATCRRSRAGHPARGPARAPCPRSSTRRGRSSAA